MTPISVRLALVGLAVLVSGFTGFSTLLARNSHRVSTAATDPGPPAALCSLGLLDVVFNYASVALGHMPRIRAHLRRFATIPGEKSGLGGWTASPWRAWTRLSRLPPVAGL